MAQSTSIKTRILILSDTHSALPYPPSTTHSPFRSPLPRADVALHCGDLTTIGKLFEYEQALQLLSSIDADLKLVIAGNHDISLDENYYALKGQYMHRLKEPDDEIVGKAKELWTGEEVRSAGVRYLEEGTYSFRLKNGARLRVYASPYQPEFCDWAFPYWRNQDRYNPPELCSPDAESIAINPIPSHPSIDILMTHGPPMSILDKTITGEHVGCSHLLRASHRCKPLLHCFGHIHEGWGAERVYWASDPSAPTSLSYDSENPNSHVAKSGWINVDKDALMEERAAFVDISTDGPQPLERGKETLMVNASIMTSQYKPVQGAWVVDLDLERDMERDMKRDGDGDREGDECGDADVEMQG